ncbi:hypothetical protein CC86DRAFT_413102 [Ophiobolus disseminans]|uniref:Uncharacterized protein n=1 Tax=Ophiobolus disseminans TaxID=1469910 RepID=A0A6A6ZEW5_9PLEO|nr:hypothetical protein CC86DRAFT_413102 [Ophiobolus disseminans]
MARWVRFTDFFMDACGPDLPSSPLGDLSNSIHPLFAQTNFKKRELKDDGTRTQVPLTDAAYKAIAPALRFVSLLITEPRMLGPFDHVANGIIVKYKNGTSYIAKGNLEGTELGLEHVKAIFQHTTHRTSFVFQTAEDPDLAGMMKFYRRYECPGNEGSELAGPIELAVHCGDQTNIRRACDGAAVVGFAGRDLLYYFEHLMTQDRPGCQLCTLLSFATTMIHEIRHAFFAFVHNAGSSRVGRVPEPHGHIKSGCSVKYTWKLWVGSLVVKT